LLFIEKNACTFFSDHGQGHFQLLAAVAAERAENVACQALRMNPDQGCSGLDVAHYQGYGGFGPSVGAEFSFETVDAEGSPASGEVGGGYLAD
jgi:hypothetical protein